MNFSAASMKRLLALAALGLLFGVTGCRAKRPSVQEQCDSLEFIYGRPKDSKP